MQVVILAGGLATRLRSLVEKVPKSMIRVNGKPFLEYQIELLKKSGLVDILLCVGYLGSQIKDYFSDGKNFGVRLSYSEEKKKLSGTGGALKKAENLLEDEFFVMYGDSYLLLDYQEIARYFHNFNKRGLMVVYKNHNQFDKSNLIVKNGLVKLYDKKGVNPEMVYIDEGISILRKEVLPGFPLSKPFALDEIFQRLIQERELLAFQTNQRFYEIGSPQGLNDFEKLILKNGAIAG